MEMIKCFKALSDKTRLRLVHVLNRYEMNVNEIVAVVEMIQSGVSRHLKILVESGLLTSRRDGSFIYYSTCRDDQISPLLSFVDENFEKDLSAEQDMQRAREVIQNRQNRTKRFFKNVAPQWDRLKKEVLGEFDLNRVLEAKLLSRGNVADLGCGTGELMEQLIRLAPEKLIGIDSSPEMLEQARMRLSDTCAQLRLGELEHLPMRNREMDAAVMNMVLHHISQPLLPIAEAFRVLKPGGLFLLSDFEQHDVERVKKIMGGAWFGFEQEKIRSWLIQVGFVLDEIESHPVNQGVAVNIFTAKKP